MAGPRPPTARRTLEAPLLRFHLNQLCSLLDHRARESPSIYPIAAVALAGAPPMDSEDALRHKIQPAPSLAKLKLAAPVFCSSTGDTCAGAKPDLSGKQIGVSEKYVGAI